MELKSVNHIAIICSDYKKSLDFYCRLLGLEIISEEYREVRKSMLTKLALNGEYFIELFTFPNSPQRVSNPEACGLRHIAFNVPNLEEAISVFERNLYPHENIRILDNGERLFFVKDPDGLPIEIIEEL